MNTCSRCGRQAPGDAAFCPYCGSALAGAAPAEPVSAPVPALAPQAAADEAAAYRCICGTWNREGEVQCASCRRPLGQMAVGRRPRPVQYVHTGPVHHPIARPDPVRERMEREDASADTLATLSVVCGVVSLLVFPYVLGLVAIACGIPAYLRGARHGLAGIIVGLLGILLAILFT